MNRLMPNTVFFGLVTACLRAKSPTKRSLVLDIATIEGVVRAPSAFSIILGAPTSITATAEFVVPKSIPMIFAIIFVLVSKFPDLHLGRTDGFASYNIAFLQNF